MRNESNSKRWLAAHQYNREENYWLKKLSGELVKSSFPYDFTSMGSEYHTTYEGFTVPGKHSSRLLALSKGSDYTLNVILTGCLITLLYKYTGNTDIIIGAPIYRQETAGEFTNTVLVLRNQLKEDMKFKELLLLMRETIIEATENQSYPLEMLVEKLNTPGTESEGFLLFDTVILIENIHEKKYIEHTRPNIIFNFSRTGDAVKGVIDYNTALYGTTAVKGIIRHFIQLLGNALNDIERPLSSLDILTGEEKEQLLYGFNHTKREYPKGKAVCELFEQQVEKTPDNTAVNGMALVGMLNVQPGTSGTIHLTYNELNKKSNQLARLLRDSGAAAESVVGVMMERSIDVVVSLLAVLKADGAYLPIEPDTPPERVLYMLADSGAGILLTHSSYLNALPFTTLRDFEADCDIKVAVTLPRSHINEFDRLPMPNRLLINLKNYKGKIGMASVTNCISLQATRGCPYECLFCHKIWSKHHIYRSAENVYNEIEYYNRQGVKNFAFIDDCFNLNREKSSRVFELIVKNKRKVQLFFPNGLRGDIMTPDYIDLMVAAGTRGINLSLETASPRLQRLIKKNLDLGKFKQVIDYIAEKHPGVILELATMHGLPSETEEEAMMTLDFIKGVKWLHFPYIHILKIFPNTEMETFALAHGISKRDIMNSRDRAFHELPETLPFPKGFTRKYQANFLNEYFLDKKRLEHVLPVQMKILNEEALCQKYNAYLPAEIKRIEDIINFAGLENLVLPEDTLETENHIPTIFDREAGTAKPMVGAKRILFLDLSQHFSSHRMLYRVVEQPLGLVSLLTYLKQRFGDKIDGRIYKAGNDFDRFEELKVLVDEYKPHLVGIRTLTFFKEFFHETAALLRQWGIEVPIITGGPYASSDYDTILKDKNVDLVVLGEGEYTLAELIQEMFNNDFKLPGVNTLKNINGIAYREGSSYRKVSREVILLDRIADKLTKVEAGNLAPAVNASSLAYVMYTSGSTGRPKGVMVEHRQVNNCIRWMQDKFCLTEKDIILQRTNLTFDPSVWEIFWPLYIGGMVKIIDAHQSKDAEFLIRLMAEYPGLTMMYCPSTLVTAMTDLLNAREVKPTLTLPWLIIGAEPIRMEVVKDFYSYFTGKVVNTYGPTECTINNTYYSIEPGDPRSSVPIGKPVANNNIYILSKNLQLVPVRSVGEICIAGDSVGRGYINKLKKTVENFIDNSFGPGLLYKTGDLGRWLEDGNIEIMGRIDEQLKVRGYRIEPGEIENSLLSHESVKECVVLARKSESDTNGKDETRGCKRCGSAENYPGVRIDEDGVCEICQNMDRYNEHLEGYFKTLDDLKQKIEEENKSGKGKYDCLLLYAGGRGAGYALYKLLKMDLKILAFTYDNGYFGRANLEDIKRITSGLGVDHIILKHPNSDQILGESLKSAHTVCRGCFHTSFSLAGEYAYNNDIRVVVGATLSRGQIIENKLMMFSQQGFPGNESELENEILNVQKSAPLVDKKIFDHIDIDIVTNGAVHNRVKFLDFYRYCNITNAEMVTYLNDTDPYWKGKRNFTVYSTNCPIKQIGDYAHLREKGYHYYGSATNWEKRLNHLSLENVKEDLKCVVTEKGYENFLKRIGVYHGSPVKEREKYLCTYFTSDKELDVPGLRDYLSTRLPHYMIPSYFVQMDQFPLLPTGKIDRKALPKPEKGRSVLKETYVPPESEMEKSISGIWQEVLNLDMVGIHDNFFELGGTSLDIIQVSSKLKDQLKREISVVTLFNYPTINALAEYLSMENTVKGGIESQRDRSAVIKEGKSRLRRSMQQRKGLI